LGLDGKTEMLKKATLTLHCPASSICHLSGNSSDSFSNPATTIFDILSILWIQGLQDVEAS